MDALPQSVSEIRRELENKGVRWSARVTVGVLMSAMQQVFDAFSRERKARQELEQRVEDMQKALDRATKGALHFQGD